MIKRDKLSADGKTSETIFYDMKAGPKDEEVPPVMMTAEEKGLEEMAAEEMLQGNVLTLSSDPKNEDRKRDDSDSDVDKISEK